MGGYIVDRNTGALIITKVRKFEDKGTFTCIAENAAGKVERQTQFLVLLRPTITSFQNVSFDQQKQSQLECRATGDPRPIISIRKDGNSRPFIIGDPRVTFENTTDGDETVLKMFFINTERSDDGLYYCRAENRGGGVEKVGQ